MKSMKTRKNSKATSINQNFNNRSIDNVLQLLEQLSNMRLIEHISMPLEKQKKLVLLTKFRQKMNHLHSLLTQIQKQGWKDVETVSTKDKSRSKNGMQSKLETLQKDQIKRVQMAYNELFIEGSFKHYKKIATVFHFPTDLEPMDMAAWARNYKNQDSYETDCCQKGCCCN